MGTQNDNVRERAKHRDRGREFQAIDHDGVAALLSKCVIVFEIAKWPADHYILKMRWPFHLSNRDGHVQPQAKMFSSPLYLLSHIDQAGSNAANGLLFGRGN